MHACGSNALKWANAHAAASLPSQSTKRTAPLTSNNLGSAGSNPDTQAGSISRCAWLANLVAPREVHVPTAHVVPGNAQQTLNPALAVKTAVRLWGHQCHAIRAMPFDLPSQVVRLDLPFGA